MPTNATSGFTANEIKKRELPLFHCNNSFHGISERFCSISALHCYKLMRGPAISGLDHRHIPECMVGSDEALANP